MGLINRCPKPSSQHCFGNGKFLRLSLFLISIQYHLGTQIHPDELLELKTFLTSTTTRKAKLKKLKRSYRPKSIIQQKDFIQPVW